MTKHGGEYIRDAFEHEQYLIITESITRLLITGCSHKGIVNIMEQYAIDAFQLHVSDFWLYPYTAERVEEAFRNLRHTPEKGSQFS